MNDRLEYMRNYRARNKKPCPACETNLIYKESTLCRSCAKTKAPTAQTLGELVYTTHHKSSAFSLVRTRARRVLPEGPCEHCGYDKHTEVCHIKAIKDFPMSASVLEINAPQNLIRLCPNCHWEFDNLPR